VQEEQRHQDGAVAVGDLDPALPGPGSGAGRPHRLRRPRSVELRRQRRGRLPS
jgi:hypothetical protein